VGPQARSRARKEKGREKSAEKGSARVGPQCDPMRGARPKGAQREKRGPAKSGKAEER